MISKMVERSPSTKVQRLSSHILFIIPIASLTSAGFITNEFTFTDAVLSLVY